MGVVRLTFKMIFYTLVIVLFIMLVPGIPPDFKFEPYTLRPPRRLEGKLTPNDILDRAELLIDGGIRGPESIAIRGDTIYTGIHGGHIIKVDKNGKWDKVVKLGGDCEDSWKSPCSRPLGLRFNRQGKLIVADAQFGLFEVDVDAGNAKQILSNTTPLSDGVPVSFADDLDIDKEGIIYFSDASKVTKMRNVYREALGDPTGRLVKFDPKTQKTEVLIDGIHFANGVQLSRKEDFLVVCETMRSRLLKYHLQGPKKGTKETFIEGLPGMPDNVRSNGKEGFYVSLVFSDTEENPNKLRDILPNPVIRKFILRTQYILLTGIEGIDTYLPNPITKWLHSYVSQLGPMGVEKANKVIIVDVDETGNIVGSLQSKNGKIALVSEIALGEKWTYFGSPYETKLWRIKTEYLI